MRKETKVEKEQGCIYSTNIYRTMAMTKALSGAAKEFHYGSQSLLEANDNLLRNTNSTFLKDIQE